MKKIYPKKLWQKVVEEIVNEVREWHDQTELEGLILDLTELRDPKVRKIFYKFLFNSTGEEQDG